MNLLGTPITSWAKWANLVDLAKTDGQIHLRDLFELDPTRSTELVYQVAGLTIDFSRQRITRTVLNELIELTQDRDLVSAKESMFSGAKINTTENRSVLHTALRLPQTESLKIEGIDVVPEIHQVIEQMSDLALQIRQRKRHGVTGKPIRYIVNIGIGGSDLGPAMAYEALKPYSDRNLEFYFVSNVDGADLFEVLQKINPEETLFIIASKTFRTQETMLNANTAKSELFSRLNRTDPEVVAKHFVAVSTDVKNVNEFGIPIDNMFEFWDWVGGRYSVDSAIGLSLMIAIGPEQFTEMLSGFHEMDLHFKNTPLENNVPALMAAVGVWNRSLLDINSVAVLPYDQYLKRFPAYLQQLTMESNGKSVTRNNLPVEVPTSAIYWGEPGTNGQHSFYQLIHQGTSVVACEILYAIKSNSPWQEHQDILVSNALGQAAVLAFGQQTEIPHKAITGNRPTTVISFEKLTPKILGALVALYEHVVFSQGVLWGINSFDQWGVELGKEIANSIAPFLSNSAEVNQFDLATKRAILDYRLSK